ncbi:unnamed protein product [Camellia sinensis]
MCWCSAYSKMSKAAVDVSMKGGFSFDLCRRNEMLIKKDLQSPSFLKTGTTIVGHIFQVIFLSTTIALPQPAAVLPLSTDSRWIVDETGRRVKLSCANWASHLDAVVAEGLSKQPIDSISKKIVLMGFNCVRLTWPLFLATNDSLANTTIRQSFRNLGLIESIAGFQVNNPSIIDHSLINVFQ